MANILKNNRVGEIGYNNQGLKMQIINYRRKNDIDVLFEDGYIARNKEYCAFKSGEIRNRLKPSLFGVGIIGENEIIDKNKKIYNSYNKWVSMLKRCYDENSLKKFPTYKECKVCEKWLYYPNFKEWYDENYYEIDGEQTELDKDILVKGNKIYSPNTCVFVPKIINSIFKTNTKKQDSLPVGIFYRKDNNKYRVIFSFKGERMNLGNYKEIDEAFKVYKEVKEKHIKILADEYKNRIPIKLYEAMYKWEVEIDD